MIILLTMTHWLTSYCQSHPEKFRGIVPPQPLNITNHCPITSATSIDGTDMTTAKISMFTIGSTSTLDDPDQRLVIIGLAGGVGLLLCLVLMLCLIITAGIACYCMHLKSRQSSRSEPHTAGHFTFIPGRFMLQISLITTVILEILESNYFKFKIFNEI